MLTPTVATKINFLYAAGNTPATSLTRGLPQGQDAAVLSLGCGDVRNILYTAYMEKGLRRNALLFSLLIDNDKDVSHDSLWDIYYHIFIDDAAKGIISKQIAKLLSISKTLNDWNNNIYGRNIHFCDEDTLDDVRQVWKRIEREAAKDESAKAALKTSQARIDPSRKLKNNMVGKDGTVMGALRSAAPVSILAEREIYRAYRQYWKEGTVAQDASAKLPNPVFVGLLSEDELLHYGTDPIAGFHLATAFAPLTETSPLKPRGAPKDPSAAAAARTQFSDWALAFEEVFGKEFVVRFAVADALLFSHSLQNAGATGKSANLYRRQWDARPFTLDAAAYVKGGSAPTEFDMIDTSNLGDHIGALNLLVAAGPLLRDQPWATLYTEQLVKKDDPNKNILENMLCGHISTVSLLLGFSPVQYWTNAKCESHVDQILLQLASAGSSMGETQLLTRLAWKRNDHFSGHTEGRGGLHVEPRSLARVIFPLYVQMFEQENLSEASSLASSRGSAYPYFHRGSLAAILKLVMNRVQTDWRYMCIALLDMIRQYESLMLDTNQLQELGAQLHIMGVSTEQWVLNEIKHRPELGRFHAWKSIPPIVAVTLVVPRQAITRLYPNSSKKIASPSLVAFLRAGPSSRNQWYNTFGDVHITFGRVREAGSRTDDDYTVSVEQDKDGWSGSSPLIAFFYVPTASLQVEPKTSLVGIAVPPTGRSSILYSHILDMDMSVFKTRLDSKSSVYVSKFLPGHSAYPAICGGVKPLDDMVAKGREDETTKLTVEIPASKSTITTITGHLDITSKKGKKLLKEKAPVELRQMSPFVINIVFGSNQLVCPLRFPIPVNATRAKTRIARASGYIEVKAPVAQDRPSEVLSDFIYPVVLTTSGLPVTLNTPHLNLENLPVVNMEKKDKMKWLTTLASFMFTDRERRLRAETDDDTGMSFDPRVNFKESLFTLFMVSSGLQRGQTGMFAINHPGKGGFHMLILVSALRIDGDAASVVVDAAIIPFTTGLLQSGKLESFLLLIQSMELCTLNVDDTELVLWKKLLPSLVERCRTWSHTSQCEYKHQKTIPLSLEPGAQLLCSCGNGKLPENYIGLPEWDQAAPHAVRVAISPTFSLPYVEEVIDLAAMKKQSQLPRRDRCRACGEAEGTDGGGLKTCSRCRQARYCSLECQKKDWKDHRGGCVET